MFDAVSGKRIVVHKTSISIRSRSSDPVSFSQSIFCGIDIFLDLALAFKARTGNHMEIEMTITRKAAVQKIRSKGLYWHLCHYELLFKKLFAGMTIDEAAKEGEVSRTMIHLRLRSLHRLVIFYIKYHYPENSDKIIELMDN